VPLDEIIGQIMKEHELDIENLERQKISEITRFEEALENCSI
jgi:hypothetical protein